MRGKSLVERFSSVVKSIHSEGERQFTIPSSTPIQYVCECRGRIYVESTCSARKSGRQLGDEARMRLR